MGFYSIIKSRRAMLGLTQQDLADYTGLSLRIIKSIETGKANPSMGTLNRVADILGLELVLKVKEKVK
ncbi:MAG: helix-turn-helix domain-containing protein [Rikenellaceae bacterium]